VYTELGDTLREQGKLDEALKAYMKALIEHAGDKTAHAGAAQVYELQNNSRQGHRRVVDLHPHGLLLGVLEQRRQEAHEGPHGPRRRLTSRTLIRAPVRLAAAAA
jgi:tetratricopeptide (TPR) repeat protein